MELPDREDYEDYYEFIAAPIALSTIGDRVKGSKYKIWCVSLKIRVAVQIHEMCRMPHS
jgi:hypothetical protein